MSRPIPIKITRISGDNFDIKEYLCFDLGSLELYWSTASIGSLETYTVARATTCINTLKARDARYTYAMEMQVDG